MNLFRKMVIFIGSGLVIIGVILAILAFAFGGRIADTAFGERIDVTDTYEDIHSVVIDYRAGSLIIKEGDSFKIVAENVSKDRFASTVTDGVWTITDKKGGVMTFLDDIDFGEKTSTVTIYIPASVLLEDCDFTVGAGKIEADRLNTKQLTIQVGAGEAAISNLSAKNADLDCGVGSISADGAITGDTVINCGVGSIVLALEGDPDSYDYDIQVGLGSANINGDRYSGVSDKQILHDNSTGSFTLDCGVGEISITITK